MNREDKKKEHFGEIERQLLGASQVKIPTSVTRRTPLSDKLTLITKVLEDFLDGYSIEGLVEKWEIDHLDIEQIIRHAIIHKWRL